MPRHTNLFKLLSKLILTNKENGLEITPIICRRSFSILLQVAFLNCSSSEVKISTTRTLSKKLYSRKVLKLLRRFHLKIFRLVLQIALPTNGTMNSKQKI